LIFFFLFSKQSARENLTPLLEAAMNVIPESQRANTPMVLRATAGLRLIGEEKANRILEKVGTGSGSG
jgi:Golgi nucleoside diphosphatase